MLFYDWSSLNIGEATKKRTKKTQNKQKTSGKIHKILSGNVEPSVGRAPNDSRSRHSASLAKHKEEVLRLR